MVHPAFNSSQHQLGLIPLSRESSPRPSSAFDDFTLFDVTDSRPPSCVLGSSASSIRSTTMPTSSNPPTLTDILLDVAPPPYTLSAFTAYLSQNHCMETLEFTLDLQRYTTAHEQLSTASASDPRAIHHLCDLWEKLMQAYIVPCAPREINIPSRVRDRLLRFPGRPQPLHPRELDEAGQIIYELMNDSLLVPFLESMSLTNLDQANSLSPQYPYFDALGASSSRSASVHAYDHEGLTDDSDANSPPPIEPMTPPTTPPTPSDGPSSSGLQRAMAAHTKSWKKTVSISATSNPPGDRRLSACSAVWQEPHPGEQLSYANGFLADRRGSENDSQRYRGIANGTVPTHTATTTSITGAPASDKDSGIHCSVATCRAQSDDGMTASTDNSTINARSGVLPISPVSLSDYEDVSSYLAVPSGYGQAHLDQFFDDSACNRIESMPDIYGWDAILDQRNVAEPDYSPRGDCHNDPSSPVSMGGRRDSTARKEGGLLHRVFSLGKQSPRITPSRRARNQH
ncbi:Regulator of G protein signaling domain [Geosmithia morbida]|uniref:Regulator of G protein signaling domain n=1 Tax=Geosmithia morbida TaxID=1094350 RepID=A0A9P5D1Z5_9HYPO|nr:Regulator of G protein signaling domain [Geosmithia morbida]KAF4120976.1 Regulator of G protein signaling domain [Geosmithia morbida]